MVDACATRLHNRESQVRVLPPLLPSESGRFAPMTTSAGFRLKF
jgi:hypothetical protein